MNGSFYIAMRGPRDSSYMSDEQLGMTYTAHKEYGADHVQSFASLCRTALLKNAKKPLASPALPRMAIQARGEVSALSRSSC